MPPITLSWNENIKYNFDSESITRPLYKAGTEKNI
jgi:hypothetical protein